MQTDTTDVVRLYVAFWPKADILIAWANVRFRGADSTDRRNTLPLYLARWNGMHMEGHARTWFHAEAEGKALRALEERPMGGRRRPSARGTRAVSKILGLNSPG